MVLVLLISHGALADEIRIQASVGEKTSTYTVTLEKNERMLRYHSSSGDSSSSKIGNKNYEFVLHASKEVIRQAIEENKKGSKLSCQRDLSTISVVGPKGYASSAQVCLFSNEPSVVALRKLLNVLQMVL